MGWGKAVNCQEGSGRGVWEGRALQAALKSFILGELRVASGLSWRRPLSDYVPRFTLTADFHEQSGNKAGTGARLGGDWDHTRGEARYDLAQTGNGGGRE